MLDVYGELFMMMAGVDMVRVPYRGAPPAVTDLAGGRVDVVFDTFPRRSLWSEPASRVRWRLRQQRARKRCQTFRPWVIFCLVTMQAVGGVLPTTACVEFFDITTASAATITNNVGGQLQR